MIPKNQAFIDWLEFTAFPSDSEDCAALASFWLSLFGGGVALPSGMFGYQFSSSCLESGRVMWSDDPRMGVHVSLPSSALGVCGYEALDLLRVVVDGRCKVTRIDIAVDSDDVPFQVVEGAILGGDLVTKSQTGRKISEFRTSDPSQQTSGTIYIGAPSSDRRVRIYDKGAERKIAGVWTRVEVQHRREHARLAAEFLLDGVPAADIVLSAVDFRDAASDSRSTRRVRVGWWSAWLAGAGDGVKFRLRSALESIERKAQWIQDSVGPTLAQLVIAFGDDRRWFYEAVNSGFARLSDLRRNVATQYRDGAYANSRLCNAY